MRIFMISINQISSKNWTQCFRNGLARSVDTRFSRRFIMVSLLNWASVKRRSNLMKHFLRRRPIWCFVCLLTFGSFVVLQQTVESDGILGRPTDKLDWLRNSNYLSSFVHPGIESELLLPANVNGLRQREENCMLRNVSAGEQTGAKCN